jgi:hypothetical protein
MSSQLDVPTSVSTLFRSSNSRNPSGFELFTLFEKGAESGLRCIRNGDNVLSCETNSATISLNSFTRGWKTRLSWPLESLGGLLKPRQPFSRTNFLERKSTCNFLKSRVAGRGGRTLLKRNLSGTTGIERRPSMTARRARSSWPVRYFH